MLASRVRQSISGAGPTSFNLVDDAAATSSRTIVTAYGSGSSKAGLFTIVNTAAALWAVVEGYATAGSTDTFTVTRTLRNSQGTANNLTWPTSGNHTIFAGECADLLAFLAQCPVTTGSGAAYALTLTPAPLALPAYAVLKFRPHVVNASGAPTLSVNGLPALPIVRADNYSLASGDLYPYTVTEVMYDPVLGRFLLLTLPPIRSVFAHCSFDNNGNLIAGMNCAGIVRGAAGTYSMVFGTPASGSYTAVASVSNDTASQHLIPIVTAHSPASVVVYTVRRADGIAADATRTSIVVFGATP